MIDPRTGATCDSCPTRLDVYGSSFKGVINKIKAAGWRISKIGEIWLHHCPKCTPPSRVTTPRPAAWYDDK